MHFQRGINIFVIIKSIYVGMGKLSIADKYHINMVIILGMGELM